jgi:hypothetical protein
VTRHGRALTVYVTLVIVAGGLGLVLSVGLWRQVVVGVWQLALFIGLAGVLDLMVVPVAGGGGAAASFAVFFAGLLVLGPGPTACVAALAAAWSEGMVRRTPAVRTSFNAAHSVLSLLAAGWVYQLLGGKPGAVQVPVGLPAMLGAMLALWLLETAWVSLAVALERGGRVWRRLRGSLGPTLALDGALAAVGLLLALLYQNGWQLLGGAGREELGYQGAALLAAVTLVPSGLLYYAYRLRGHLRQVYAQSLRTLGALVEAKVEGGQPGHGEQVAALAAALAQALELPPAQVEQIRYAGYLHDIGKVGVPVELLGRNRDAFSGEPQPLRLHPQLGEQILAPVQFLRPAAQMVRAHHERWDGLGYPDGLRAEQIPLGARLLTLADAYVSRARDTSATAPAQVEAPALSHLEHALSRLRQACGSRFDPELVETLAGVLRRDGELGSQLTKAADAPAPA